MTSSNASSDNVTRHDSNTKVGKETEYTEKQVELAGASVEQVRNAELYDAVRESKIQKWSKTSLHLYFAIFVAFCCCCANGYDGSLLTGILSMKHFQATFQTGIDGPKVSLMASMYTVGQMIAAPFAAVLSDRYGRRKAMFFGSWFIIVGMIIAVAGGHLATFTVGRFVLGCGITFLATAAPAYTMEIAPPQWRGRATGLYNVGWFGGAIPASAVTFGTNYIDSNWSWRIPLILQAFACCIVICFVFTIPESPRFQMANGQEDKAFEFLVKYHGGGDVNDKLVAFEIAEFQEGIRIDGADKRWWDYSPFYKTHSGRWRFLQVVLMAVSGQFSGNGLAYFNTVIYGKLGIESVNEQLAYNLLWSVIAACGAIIGASLTDRMPRRMVLVWGTLVCAGWLAVNAGLQQSIATKGATTSTAQGALAGYFLFSFCYMFTYTPLQAVIPVEAMETTIRAKGLAANNFICGAMGFLNQFAGPIALKNIGYNYVWFFVAWDTVEAGLWYLFGVEGQGRSLEELNWVYEQPYPVKASKTKQKVVVDSTGHVHEDVNVRA